MTILNSKITTIAKHALFWIIIFIFDVGVLDSNYFSGGYKEIMDGYLFKTILQIILAYTILNFLMPYFTKKKWISFSLFTAAFLFITHTIYQLYRIHYLEVTYPDSYVGFLKNNPNTSVIERILDLRYFVGISMFYLQPTFFLLIHKFYMNQQKLLKVNEQKKVNELAMLKHQLNPHFYLIL